MIPNVLSIAGTDPTCGAGIQADLKAMYALGAYGMSVITAVVAQNTQGVRRFVALEPDFVAEQLDAVFDDVRVDAIKIGMVANVVNENNCYYSFLSLSCAPACPLMCVLAALSFSTVSYSANVCLPVNDAPVLTHS